MTRNGCSTLARTLDFVRFLPRSTSSTMPRDRWPAVASSWVERFNNRAHLTPGNDLVHLSQELRAASLLAVFVEACARQGELPHLSQLCRCGCSPIDRRVAVSRRTCSEV